MSPLFGSSHKKTHLEKLAELSPKTRVGVKEEAILSREQKSKQEQNMNQGERDLALLALASSAGRPPHLYPMPLLHQKLHLIAQTLAFRRHLYVQVKSKRKPSLWLSEVNCVLK